MSPPQTELDVNEHILADKIERIYENYTWVTKEAFIKSLNY